MDSSDNSVFVRRWARKTLATQGVHKGSYAEDKRERSFHSSFLYNFLYGFADLFQAVTTQVHPHHKHAHKGSPKSL